MSSPDEAYTWRRDGLILAHTYRDPDDVRVLRDFPDASVALLIESDETYDPKLAYAVRQTPAVAQVLRNYPVHPQSSRRNARTLRYGTQEVLDAPLGSWPSGVRAIAAGLVMTHRHARLRRLYGHRTRVGGGLPLGYTDMFVQGLQLAAARGVIPDPPSKGSLLPYLSGLRRELSARKSISLCFVGQRGRFQRAAGIDRASQFGWDVGPIRSGFEAAGQDRAEASFEYIRSLVDSRFALCPPGNYSGDSFRLTEAVLLGCVPVEVGHTLSDPLRPEALWHGGAGIVGRTWTEALHQLENVDPDLAERMSALAFGSLASAIDQASRLLRDDGTE